MSIIRFSLLSRRTAIMSSRLRTITAWHVETVARCAAVPSRGEGTSDAGIPGVPRAIFPGVFAHAWSTLREFPAAQRARVGSATQRLHSIPSSLPCWTTIDAHSPDAKIPAVVHPRSNELPRRHSSRESLWPCRRTQMSSTEAPHSKGGFPDRVARLPSEPGR